MQPKQRELSPTKTSRLFTGLLILKKLMEPRYDWAKEKARAVLQELDVIQLEDLSDLEKLCMGRGVCVSYQKMRNLEGVLVRSRRIIGVRSDIPELGRKRFTIAHELGHWEMHPGLNQLQACTAADIHGYRGSAAELEANTFAAEFLMPDFMLTEQMRYLSPTIDTAKKLAARFQTSLTATAVRLCEYTNLPIFVAFSTNGKVRWYRRSARARDYYFIQRGSELDGESLARYCTETPDDATEPVEVESSAWFPEDYHRARFKVFEESVELGDYGVTLSIISVDD